MRLRVRGVVQGVGFRPWVARLARGLALRGRVRNEGAGVVVEAWGEPSRLAELEAALSRPAPAAARVEAIGREPLAGARPAGFEIAPSDPAPGRRLAVSPDLATCEECLAELRDPASPRHRDPFVGCAACGPRFTVSNDLPFDRERTSLAAFPRCGRCAREHADPGDRRFHAQTPTCPRCGPELVLLAPDGARLATGEAALAAAARRLRAGGIVAVLGLGGFHLACDARSDSAVAALRARKRRARKPLAVMAADLAALEDLATLSAAERELIASSARPIVLAARRPDARLAAGIAPGSPRLGVFLPCTGVQHLLLEAADGPLVMTSGNRSGDPLACTIPDALERLGGIADAFLAHDRDVRTACDDSVAQLVGGEVAWLRRSRGLVPAPLRLRRPVSRPILAVGGHLHNTVCLAIGDEAFLSRHHGDLESPDAFAAFEQSVDQLVRWTGVGPEAIAHDLHPLYATTRWALGQAAVPRIAVQHHHAHVASVLAEHAVTGPALGLAWDGTGYGPDGAAWGGELLLVDGDHFQRLATLRPLRLAGGEIAIRETWRLALAALLDAFGDAPPWSHLPLAARVPDARVAAVRRVLERPALCVPAHGAGRWFDAVGALVLGLPEADFQGEVALAWNHAALGGGPATRAAAPYPFALDLERAPWEIELRPLVRGLVADALAGTPAAEIARRFHETLAAAAAAVVAEARRRLGELPLALAGGCFQNGLLVERILDTLPGRTLRALHAPTGDGGLALGQVWAADARLRREESLPCV